LWRGFGGSDLFNCRFLDADRLGGAPEIQEPLLIAGDQLVAWLFRGQALRILDTDALNAVIRRFQMLVGQKQDADLLALLDPKNGTALLVKKVGSHVHRQLRQDALGVLLQLVLGRRRRDAGAKVELKEPSLSFVVPFRTPWSRRR